MITDDVPRWCSGPRAFWSSSEGPSSPSVASLSLGDEGLPHDPHRRQLGSHLFHRLPGLPLASERRPSPSLRLDSSRTNLRSLSRNLDIFPSSSDESSSSSLSEAPMETFSPGCREASKVSFSSHSSVTPHSSNLSLRSAGAAPASMASASADAPSSPAAGPASSPSPRPLRRPCRHHTQPGIRR
jgi:hypothetical protein